MLHSWKRQVRAIATAALSALLLVIPVLAFSGSLPDHGYPRVAAFYLNPDISPEAARQIAQWDVAILNMQAQEASPDQLRNLRNLNPDIVLLAYTSAIEYPVENLSVVEPSGQGLWHDMGRGITDDWYLMNGSGEHAVFWPGNVLMNLGATNASGVTYGQHLARFLQDRVLASGLWDGLIFDTVWNTVHWVDDDIDIDGDGRGDSIEKINAGWYAGQDSFFRDLRHITGPDALILGIGEGDYGHVLNGRMFEGFPEPWEGGWKGSMARYDDVDDTGYGPRINIINSDTENTGNKDDYRAMRFGLASALMFNGYYNFDWGTEFRSSLWWYDEFEASLGDPAGAPRNLTGSSDAFGPGLWRRDFTGGVALVNSTSQTRTVELYGEYEKLHGRQDPNTNDGSRVTTVTIPPLDGIIMLRAVAEVQGASYVNGSFVRVFDEAGNTARSGFFSYDSRFAGGRRVLSADIDGDGQMEGLSAGSSDVEIWDDGRVVASFHPYGTGYDRGINVAVGDLNGDGTQEIITGTENGGGPHIRVFNAQGRLINPGFFAYGPEFRGGVRISVGDLNGDGTAEIVAGAGPRGGPHVRIFNKDGQLINPGFFAYDPSFRGGVDVEVADLDGDGTSEIVTAPGAGGGPEVRVFDRDGTLRSSFLAFDRSLDTGLDVLSADMDGDGLPEIIAATNDIFSLATGR